MTNEPTQEPKPRTYLPADEEYITWLLSQNQVWVTRTKEGTAQEIAIWGIEKDHLENVVSWLETQVSYILKVLGKQPDRISEATQVHWLHQQPLVKALNARLIHLRQEAQKETPKTFPTAGTWLEQPLAALDIETTGVDLENDRMVSFSIGVAEEPGDWKSVTQIINPGVEIPTGASDIHGITTERARSEGLDPVPALHSLKTALGHFRTDGTPVIGHGVRFDLTILDRELRRHSGEGLDIGYVLDTLVIDKGIDTYRKGSRKLADVCRHYGVDGQPEGHEADNDALYALRLLWSMLTGPKAYQFFDGRFPSLEQLQDHQRQWFAEQTEHMAQWRARQGKHANRDTSWPIAATPDQSTVPWDH